MQRFVRVLRQWTHSPHSGAKRVITWSPGATSVVPGPTASMTPAPSWPSTHGAYPLGSAPEAVYRSVWQTPQAASRTSASPPLGSARSTSWTASGAPNSSSTAARIFMSGVCHADAFERRGRNRRHRVLREREGRARVDLADHVGVLARGGRRPVEEVDVPDHRQVERLDAGDQLELGHPALDLSTQPRESLLGGKHERLGSGRARLVKWHQAPRILVREADDLVVAEVDADHPFREPFLERLLDDH